MKYDIRNPATGGKLLSPVAFNLMFQTSIGPLSNNPAYLRHETSQGQFSNLQKLLNFNNEAMPPPQKLHLLQLENPSEMKSPQNRACFEFVSSL